MEIEARHRGEGAFRRLGGGRPLRCGGASWRGRTCRRNRGKPGRIDEFAGTLPEIKERIDTLLAAGVSQVEIIRRLDAPLRDAGEAPLSPAGLSRYASRMGQVGAELRDIQAFADVWGRRADQPMGDVSAMTIQVMQALQFRKAMRLSQAEEDGDETEGTGFGELVLSIQRLERTAALNEARVRERLKEFAARAADRAAESAAREAGDALPPEALLRIRRDVYGIHDE